MAMWNKVVSGFDRDEETVNFGARAIAEKDGSLFETSTIATIETDGVVSDEPRVFASVQYSRVCVAIDKSITIFEDETCEAILLNANFDSLISCYCISEDGFFLFIVLAIGSLHCLHLSNGGKVIFSKNIVHGNDTVTRIFAHSEKPDSIIVTFVTKNGTIHRVSGLDKGKAESLLKDNDETVLQEAANSIRCTQIFNGFSNDEVIYANGKIAKGKLTIAMVCSNSLFTWPSQCHTSFEGLQYKYKKVKFLKIYDAMLCLRTDNMLNVVCQRTLIGLKVCSEAISDFTVMGGETDEPCQILMLLKSKTELVYTLRVVSYPGFTEKFQITVPGLIHLINITDYYSEGVLFIECMKSNEKIVSGGIDTVRIKAISESVPEYQLQRLVRRGLFDAAEDFAQKYKLSIDSIYCAKAALLMSNFGPWGPQKSNSIELDTFIEVLDKIKSVQYVAECCSKVLIPEYKGMRKLHLYARKRIMANIEKIKSNEYSDLLYSINSILHKLETFHIICGHQSKTDVYDEKMFKEWIRFSRADFMEEYKTHLRLGEMEAAALIWTRHLLGTETKISLKMVQEIFDTVPKELTPLDLWPWMSHFIPSLLTIIPDGISEVIFWAYRKIKSLEQTHRKEFPVIAIGFVEKIIKLTHIQKNSPCISIHQEYTSQNSGLKQFTRLMQALSDIRKLKCNENIIISLDAYSGEPMEVCHILLDKVPIHSILRITGFVENFLNQYMVNNSLQNDVVFSSYIKKLTRHSKSWWSSEEAPWENRACLMISLIQDVEIRLQQTLDVLRKAPVPWSLPIAALAETSFTMRHDLNSKIRMECNYVPIKLILKKYGYESIGVNEQLIFRVIKVNDDKMIEHINELTKDDQTKKEKAFSACITYHLNAGNHKVAMQVLHSLDDETLSFCCLCIVNYVDSCMRLKSSSVENAIPFAELFGWVKSRMEVMIEKYKNNPDRIDICYHIISSINEFEPRFIIWKELKINLDSEEYLLKKDQVLANYAETLCGDTEKDHDLDVICKSLFRMADLLKLNRLTVISLLMKKTKNAALLDYFKADGGKLIVTPDETKYINEICFSALQHTKLDVNAARKIKHLSAAALCACPADQCNYSLLPYTAANLYCETFDQQSTMVLDQTREHSSRNVNWNLYPIYKDLAITTDHLIFPILQEMLILRKAQIDCLSLSSGGEKKMTVVQHTQMMQSLLDQIKSIKIEHNDHCVLKIVQNLYCGYYALSNANTDMVNEIKTMLRQLLRKLLAKVMNARKFDLQLALSCLFMLSESNFRSNFYQMLHSKDYKKTLITAVLGYEYNRLLKQKDEIRHFGYLKMLHSWVQRLSKYSISYKDIMTSSNDDRRRVLQQLMNSNVEEMIPIFNDFCIDFGFNVTDCYILYLEKIIKAWNPTLNFVTSSDKKELQISEDEVCELRQQCNILADNISDKVALKTCIKNILPEINFYYYELFLILMDLRGEKNTENQNYICFLQNYTRVGPPTRVEFDEWMHIAPGDRSLPSIAQWRLPFLPKIDLWTLMKLELNLSTYEKWLSIAPVLKLQPHLICTLAVKGEMNRVWGKYDTRPRGEEWTLLPKNGTLLTNIKKCIEHMNEPDAIYYRVVALYYVVNHTPPGADLVAVAEECYKYAQISAQKFVRLEEGMLEKIKMKYFRIKSEHILRTHGLGVDRYLSLIENPEKLVRQLYMDESIPQRFTTVMNHRPDINAAVNALSEFFDINVIKLRLSLLQEWLQPHPRCVKFDQTFTETIPIVANTTQSINYDDNLLRACYMLEHGDIVQSANYLINIGFGDNKDDYSFGTRYRALQILQMMLDVNTLEDLTKRNLSTIRQYMSSLKYISMLEAFGLVYSIDTFETCCKRELVQILWKTQYHSPQALVLIAHICMDFEIYEYSLWDKNLSQMAKFSLTTELKNILLHLRNISVIVNSNGYLAAWKAVLTRPFKTLDVQPTSEQIQDCNEALNLLHSCPILHLLEFTDIISCCFQYKQPHFAIGLLPFLNQTDRQYVLQTIKNKFDMSKELHELLDLEMGGVLLLPQCRRIVEETELET